MACSGARSAAGNAWDEVNAEIPSDAVARNKQLSRSAHPPDREDHQKDFGSPSTIGSRNLPESKAPPGARVPLPALLHLLQAGYGNDCRPSFRLSPQFAGDSVARQWSESHQGKADRRSPIKALYE